MCQVKNKEQRAKNKEQRTKLMCKCVNVLMCQLKNKEQRAKTCSLQPVALPAGRQAVA